ncbi:competence/damage-inducible protein A [Aeromonas hydrophila]|uniref:CinA-like protein n=1 Tax=Aeromonas hydrophila subsp. hydrophila (strain ATCC 7966 / DSM 30187 / BCRC 13018 / CCUG 14551 / JCM 1027 / KCTC 2358 / NCIMB 9240 / NCTC 8049) TaxID=380703 RepID=A0KFJ4_AERHH|nr:CinA family nicotinamide mononucleotide deamidase-related protein [Aeromonas hydrophila]ABK37416.1 competence/damage-inducible protein CinA [Aeromonas hydrophila subsp. hydrophila ATCC 7966]MBS4673518.1 CinA family nicotinamide mononucleotide deamidase-related protein [Aeromonas hydrophila]OOD36404.1 competence/damage-inducible protein A [Aeromonas hydrophila]SUU15407.1 competence/damage-inducible protein CinA [Aeromonas hydrophila]
MRIEIISTGDEIVTGLVVDTNAAWLSALLLEQGWQVRRRVTVGDNLKDLKTVLAESASRAEVVLVCGGLGPTADDLTAQAAAEAFDQPLTLFPDWLATIEARYASRGRPMPASNAKQAWLPQGGEILDNPVGTACGFVVTHTGHQGPSLLFFTPGVPFEFKQMVREQIMPRLKALAGAQTDTELRRFYTFGVSESALSDMLDAAPWPAGIELGYRSSMPLIELKLIGHGASAADMDAAEARLLAAIEPWLVGRGDKEPAQQILDLLGDKPLTLLEGESRGALLAMCHPHPALTASFSHALASELAQLAAPAAPLSLTIGRAGPDGVPLLLCVDGQLYGQTLKVSHPDPDSGRRIIAFAALDMLRRQLQGLPVLGDYRTLARTASR